MHWFTDVIGGALLGLMIVAPASLVRLRWGRPARSRPGLGRSDGLIEDAAAILPVGRPAPRRPGDAGAQLPRHEAPGPAVPVVRPDVVLLESNVLLHDVVPGTATSPGGADLAIRPVKPHIVGRAAGHRRSGLNTKLLSMTRRCWVFHRQSSKYGSFAIKSGLLQFATVATRGLTSVV